MGCVRVVDVGFILFLFSRLVGLFAVALFFFVT